MPTTKAGTRWDCPESHPMWPSTPSGKKHLQLLGRFFWNEKDFMTWDISELTGPSGTISVGINQSPHQREASIYGRGDTGSLACISLPQAALETRGQRDHHCRHSWGWNSASERSGKQRMFNDLGHGENPHTDFVCSFALCWIFFFPHCNNLFLSYYHKFGLKADLLREIAFFRSTVNTGGVLHCSGTDRKKSARGTWRIKEGGIEKSTQLVKTSRKFL